MVFNVLRPGNDIWPNHMCTDDVIDISRKITPKLIVITHYGMKMIKADPIQEARRVAKETGIQTVSARDGTKINIVTSMKSENLSDFVSRSGRY